MRVDPARHNSSYSSSSPALRADPRPRCERPCRRPLPLLGHEAGPLEHRNVLLHGREAHRVVVRQLGNALCLRDGPAEDVATSRVRQRSEDQVGIGGETFVQPYGCIIWPVKRDELPTDEQSYERATVQHLKWRTHQMATATVYPCLWFDGKAEDAAAFYTSLLPDSHIDKIWRSPAETPSGPAGMVLTVDFTVAGQRFQGLNGGPDFSFNEAISIVIECDGPGGGRPALERADGRRRGTRAVRLAEGSLRAVVADRAAAPQRASRRSGPGPRTPGDGVDAADGQDRGRGARAGGRRCLTKQAGSADPAPNLASAASPGAHLRNP